MPRPDILQFDAQHLWHPYASMPPRVASYAVESASGVELQLADGRRVIDGMSSWWTAIHGYGHPALKRALETQSQRMCHVMFGGLTHEPAVELARELLEIVPAGLDTIFFADSGSVSVEVSLKIALQYQAAVGATARTRFLALRGGYHGDTFGAMSVTDPGTGMRHALANVATHPFAARPEVRFGGRWEPDSGQQLEQCFLAHASELAAVIIEPVVQGAGGMWFYHPEYVSLLRALCKQHGVLLICDEIATGFGRTGKLFAVEHAGVAPDVLCIGKALTGGTLTLAATLTTRDIAETIGRGKEGVLLHGPTFMANPLACAVAHASVRELRQSPWQERVLRIESELGSGLAPLVGAAGVKDVRTLGAIGVVQLTSAVDVERTQRLLLERGVWLRPFRDLLYTMPPFVSDSDAIARITSAMVDVVRQTT